MSVETTDSVSESRVGICRVTAVVMENKFYLASGLHSLPDAEVADDPGNSQTDNQVPVQ